MRQALALGTLALALLAGPAIAETNEEKFEKKLKEPFVQNADWVLDFDEALAKAKETKKPVFAYFTRSYAP